jgi:hypothetical protein
LRRCIPNPDVAGANWVFESRHGLLAVPQPGQQVLSHVRDFFQLVESQKTARTFNGVNGAKHPGQRILVFRVLFQPD